MAIAAVPSRSRRCRLALPAADGVRPSRRLGAASEAVCSVEYVARSAGVPKFLRLRANMMRTVAGAARRLCDR